MKNLVKFKSKEISKKETCELAGGNAQLQNAWDVGYREGSVAANLYINGSWSLPRTQGHVRWWCSNRVNGQYRRDCLISALNGVRDKFDSRGVNRDFLNRINFNNL